MIVKDEAKQISDQFRAYAFCDECEGRLSKNGEGWVLGRVPHDYDGPMPLQDALKAIKPAIKGKDVILFDVSRSPAFDLTKLIYFGISIFWRGAAREWKTTAGEVAPQVDLGAFEELLRLFLLEKGPLPKEVVLTIDIWPYEKALQVSYPPIASPIPECNRYWFHIPGLVFSLYVGPNIPAHVLVRDARSGAIGLDVTSANSIIEYTKDGVKRFAESEKVKKMLLEIAKVRAKAPRSK
jgi:hypothetical protein